ncbi:ABC transporter substrate-binding protein [Flindersiella endophytica]
MLTVSNLRPRRGVFTAALALVLLAVGSIGSACSAGSTGNQSSDKGTTPGKELSVGFAAEPLSLDFTSDNGAAIPQALLVNVYEGLVNLDANGDIKPLLAKDWAVSADRKTYTFHLREGVKFSDGKPFTAEDAAFSINRVKTDWKIDIKSAMEVVDSAKAVDPTTLEVVLKQPSNLWLFKMTTRIGAMFSRTGVSGLKTKAIGTGPYIVQRWTRGTSIVLARNPGYWGPKPALDKVTLKYYKDPNAMNNALRTGGLDVVSTLQAPESLSQFSDKSKYQVIEGTTNGEVVLSFNNARPPFTDKRVRQAIRYALDHKAILDTAWAGHGELIGSMVPPTDPWYEDLTGLYPHDPAKARALLRAAGKPKLTLRLRIPNLPYAVSTAQVVKSQLADVGITAKIEPLEFPAVWLDEVFKKADYDMSIIAHVEPRDITSWGIPAYYWKYDSKPFQELLAKADAGTEQEQVTYMKQAARLLSEDAAGDFLFLFPNLMVATPQVKGLPKNAVSEAFDLTTVSKG